jgi:hypothetical protein
MNFDWLLDHLDEVIVVIFLVGGALAPLFRRSSRTQEKASPPPATMKREPGTEEALEQRARRFFEEITGERQMPPADEAAPQKVPRKPVPAKPKTPPKPSPKQPQTITAKEALPRSELLSQVQTLAAERSPNEEKGVVLIKQAAQVRAIDAPRSAKRFEPEALKKLARGSNVRLAILWKEILDPPLGERPPREMER